MGASISSETVTCVGSTVSGSFFTMIRPMMFCCSATLLIRWTSPCVKAASVNFGNSFFIAASVSVNSRGLFFSFFRARSVCAATTNCSASSSVTLRSSFDVSKSRT